MSNRQLQRELDKAWFIVSQAAARAKAYQIFDHGYATDQEVETTTLTLCGLQAAMERLARLDEHGKQA